MVIAWGVGLLVTAVGVVALSWDEPGGLVFLGTGAAVLVLSAGFTWHPLAEYDPETNSVTEFGPFGLRVVRSPSRAPGRAGKLEAVETHIVLRRDGNRPLTVMWQVLENDDDFIAVHRMVRQRHSDTPTTPPPAVPQRAKAVMLFIALLPLVGVVSANAWSAIRERDEARLLELSQTVALDLCDPDRWAAFERTWPGSFIEVDANLGTSIPNFWCSVDATLPLGDEAEVELRLFLYAIPRESTGDYEGRIRRGEWMIELSVSVREWGVVDADAELIEQAKANLTEPVDLYPLELIS
ncbi:hypothetical protein AB0B28_05540 [Glycomyces sp. NPDC046736]|uniref:hypothetical protein n=1 Tax=Glycomyces sp. NPDC046736 TaxID=3155615 RepID=UPI0033CB4B74